MKCEMKNSSENIHIVILYGMFLSDVTPFVFSDDHLFVKQSIFWHAKINVTKMINDDAIYIDSCDPSSKCDNTDLFPYSKANNYEFLITFCFNHLCFA